MSRSLKKPPFVHYKLMKRVDDAQAAKSKSVIKTWSRASTITPEFVGLTFAVHNGNEIHTRFCYGKYGRAQIRRICTYSKFQRSRW